MITPHRLPKIATFTVRTAFGCACHDRHVTGEAGRPGRMKYVLFDVDGTLIDALSNQRRVWETWAARYGLDGDEVYRVALRTRPMETFAQVAGDREPSECLALLHELEDEDVRSGVYAAFHGASELLHGLPPEAWALVTSNYEHRVRGRFARTGLPVPDVIVDAAAVEEGKPSPVPYLQAAARLGAPPADCLVIEDAPSGVRSGLRAGMTVWGVNTAAAVEGVHRHFVTLREAVPHILAWASGPQRNAAV
jgi:mannitol-1-/sugar-/sorbitol-6-phosphatase